MTNTKFITITNPDGKTVWINVAHIIYFQEYNYTIIDMLGTRIVLTGQNDEIQFAHEAPSVIKSKIAL